MSAGFAQLVERFDAVTRDALASQARDRGLSAQDATRNAGDHAALARLFGDAPPLALVAFDTPGIQDYVFRVHRPIDVRGGSQIVADFTAAPADLPADGASRSLHARLRRPGLDVPADAVIYAGGGGGIVLVPAHKAEAVRAAIESVLAEATQHDLRSAAAALPVWPDDLSRAPAAGDWPPALAQLLDPPAATTRYAATRAVLLALLAERRSQTAALAAPVPVERQAERCDACHARVGDKRRDPDGNETRLCPGCDVRRGVGARAGRGAEQVRTFEDVVAGTGSNALAVIYADGANFGALFRDVQSPAQHRALSDAVDAAFHTAAEQVRELSRDLARDDDDEGIRELRVQMPIRGGDDLVIVLPAVIAMAAVERLLRTIEEQLTAAGHATLRPAFAGAPDATRTAVERLGVGIGVAIADHHFPIRFLLGYAHELLDGAKAHIRRTGQRSAVDFMVLTSGSPLSGSIEKLRERHFLVQPENGEPERLLTQRPYTRAGFERFLDRARALHDVAPSQAFAVREDVLGGYATSLGFWRYQHARSRSGADSWERYRDALGAEMDDVDRLLWQPGEAPASAAAARVRGPVRPIPDRPRVDRPPTRVSTDYLDAVEVRDCLRGVREPAGSSRRSNTGRTA